MLLAKSFLISSIPLPKTYIQNLDPYECDNICLQEYLDTEQIFSFLAHTDKKLEDEALDEIRVMNISILNLGSHVLSSSEVRVALLLPYKRIGKYTSSTTNAVFAYLMTKGHPFELKSYKIENENVESIEVALQAIQDDGFAYVIAPLTHVGAQNLMTLESDLNIYLPTINKNSLENSIANVTFGAIDYQAQSEMLIQEAVSPLVIFSDKSTTGDKLSHYQEENFQMINPKHKTIKYYLKRRTTNLESKLKKNKKIVEGSFIVNTPIIKSGMIMSQLTLYDVNATNVLSTQINYNPLILSMTQYVDRENMIVANSIVEHNKIITETNSLLNNDIVYDWINYTTTVGMDYFYNQITYEEREYNIPIIDQQLHYQIELLKPSISRFIKYAQKKSKEF
jgi:hypothetical protein